MGGAGLLTLEAASTFQKIRRNATPFAAQARTTQCAWMEQTRRLQGNLSRGHKFPLLLQRNGSWGKPSPILPAAITDMRGWRIQLCIGGTCSRSRAIFGWCAMLHLAAGNIYRLK